MPANTDKRNTAPSSPRASSRRRRRCKHTVLWIDDDPSVSAAMARRLLRKSVRVIPAADGMQGYWLALTRRPDVIVTDLKMPRWEGGEVLRCLQQNDTTRELPTIVLSGYAGQLDQQEIDAWGVEAVLEKPVDFDLLLSTLRRCWSPATAADLNKAEEPDNSGELSVGA